MHIIAHRGASYYEPENTLISLGRALKWKADYIEFDVRKTQDDHLVVIHDSKVDRTTNGTGKLSEMALNDVKKLDAGNRQLIPTLDEVLDLIGNKTRILLEIKQKGIEEEILDKLTSYNLHDPLIASFYHSSVQKVKNINSNLETGIILASQPVNVSSIALEVNADAVFIKKKYLDQKMVKEVKNNNISIYPWVVDDLNQAKMFQEIGVSGIVTNKLFDKNKFF
ncbi:MAG: glycerophosphodiester phosphodiesterase [Methanomicrobiales archaeon]